MEKQITILLPVYNGEKYLQPTLNSLLNQSWQDFELLVLDDGSTDSSIDILHSIKDDRIRVIRQKHHGLSHVLNKGIFEARTPYVARNDQDDLSLPHRLERQLMVMKAYPEIGILFSYYTKFGAVRKWNNVDKQDCSPGKIKPFNPLRDGCQLGSTMFARTNLLRSSGGYRQEYYPADDWDLALRLAPTGNIFLLCEPLVSYRFHIGANTYRFFKVMQEKSRWAEDSFHKRIQNEQELSYDRFLDTRSKKRWDRMNRTRIDFAKLLMRAAGQYYLDGVTSTAFFYMLGSFIFNPVELIGRLIRMVRRTFH